MCFERVLARADTLLPATPAQVTRKLQEAAAPRQLLEAVDVGTSWGEILRFKGLAFACAGWGGVC